VTKISIFPEGTARPPRTRTLLCNPARIR
jgi:hypothetical protein